MGFFYAAIAGPRKGNREVAEHRVGGGLGLFEGRGVARAGDDLEAPSAQLVGEPLADGDGHAGGAVSPEHQRGRAHLGEPRAERRHVGLRAREHAPLALSRFGQVEGLAPRVEERWVEAVARREDVAAEVSVQHRAPVHLLEHEGPEHGHDGESRAKGLRRLDGHGAHQHESVDELGPVGREREGDEAAEVEAGDVGARRADAREQVAERVGERVAGEGVARGLLARARAGQVGHDHPEARREARRGGHPHAVVGEEAVHQHQRLSVARLVVAHADAAQQKVVRRELRGGSGANRVGVTHGAWDAITVSRVVASAAVAIDLDTLRRRLRAGVDAGGVGPAEGRVVSVRGFTVRATVVGARVGDLVTIDRPGGALGAEVVGFDDALAVLMPLGDVAGVGLDDPVRLTGGRASFACGEGVLGRVLGPLGAPCDGLGPLAGETVRWEVDRAPPAPLSRQRVGEALPLGVRAIDAVATVGAGQRVGLFAGAGAGKTSLLAEVARGAKADAVVIALVGERGREVRDFLDGALDEASRRRACVVVATSDEAPVLRVRAAGVALSVAEFFRDRGARVLLLVDSLTRVARAQREVGLAAGEPSVRRGFPPSVFAMLPRLVERAGAGERGAITALFTVLVEGGDLDDPIADEVRGLLDGHVVLDRAIGARGRWPAVDVTRSLSRVMDALVTEEHRAAAARLRAWVSALEAGRDLVAMGAYTPGRDRALDEALSKREAIEAFLAQPAGAGCSFEDTVRRLRAL